MRQQFRVFLTLKKIMTTPSIFKIREKSSLDCQIFLDDAGTTDIARFDEAKYPIFLKQAELMADELDHV